MSDELKACECMEQPCQCDCGNWFDLNEGNPCGMCNKVMCEKCIEQPFENCPECKRREQEGKE